MTDTNGTPQLQPVTTEETMVQQDLWTAIKDMIAKERLQRISFEAEIKKKRGEPLPSGTQSFQIPRALITSTAQERVLSPIGTVLHILEATFEEKLDKNQVERIVTTLSKNDFYNFLLKRETEYKKARKHLKGFPIATHIREFCESSLSAEDAAAANEVIVDIDSNYQHMAKLSDAFMENAFLLKWEKGNFDYHSPIVPTEEDRLLFSTLVCQNLFLLLPPVDRPFIDKAHEALNNRLKEHEDYIAEQHNSRRAASLQKRAERKLAKDERLTNAIRSLPPVTHPTPDDAISTVIDTAALAASARAALLELPTEWKELLGTEYMATHRTNGEAANNGECSRHTNEKYWDIKSTDFPSLGFTTKRSVELATFKRNMTQLITNVALVKDLTKECGFTLDADVGGVPTLTHPEYGISVLLNASLEEQTERLVKASGQFRSCDFQQQSILENAQQVGFKIEGIGHEAQATGPITVSHADLQPPVIAKRGYLTFKDFYTIRNLVTDIQREQELPDIAALGANLLPVPPQTKNIPWAQDPKETLLIYDNSTLHKLNTPRNALGRTWIDIIKCTARLPHIKVVIPARIADLEMRGKVANYDEQGNFLHLTTVNPNFEDKNHPLNERGKTADKFLETATRARIKDGKVEIIKLGENRNLIIMETDTPEDRLLDKVLHEIAAEPSDKQKLKRLREEIYKKDEGENAINRIVKYYPYKNRMAIISDDKVYLQTAPHVSGQDMPVTHASALSYLRAEINLREKALRSMLQRSEPREEDRTCPISLFRISGDIVENWKRLQEKYPLHKKDGPEYLFDYGTPGYYAHAPGLYVDMHNIIQEAVAETKKNGNGAATDAVGRWTSATPPTPITPNEIKDRSDDSLGRGA